MDDNDLPWRGYDGLWRVIGRPHLGSAKSQGHEGQEGIEKRRDWVRDSVEWEQWVP
jgi:hypothetical protein